MYKGNGAGKDRDVLQRKPFSRRRQLRARRKRLLGSMSLHTRYATDDTLQEAAGDFGIVAPLILIQFVDEATGDLRLSVLTEKQRVVRHGFDICLHRFHQVKDALYPFRLTGDSSVCGRSAAGLLNALKTLGVEIKCETKEGYAPFTVCGPIHSGKVKIDCPTSQYLSALLLALPLADGNFEIKTGILKEKPYVDMTKRWMNEQIISFQSDENYTDVFIPGGQIYRPFDRTIPADFSSACFFLCAAAVTRSRLTLTGLDMTDAQGDKAVVFLLEKAGCRIELQGDRLTIEGGRLKAFSADMNDIPDALPILAVTACFADGETRLFNAAHTRQKETDRIRCMTEELTKLGADITELPDGMVIRGTGLRGGCVCSRGDHRIAMAMAVAGLAADAPVTVEGAEAAAVTFPAFFETLAAVCETPPAASG